MTAPPPPMVRSTMRPAQPLATLLGLPVLYPPLGPAVSIKPASSRPARKAPAPDQQQRAAALAEDAVLRPVCAMVLDDEDLAYVAHVRKATSRAGLPPVAVPRLYDGGMPHLEPASSSDEDEPFVDLLTGLDARALRDRAPPSDAVDAAAAAELLLAGAEDDAPPDGDSARPDQLLRRRMLRAARAARGMRRPELVAYVLLRLAERVAELPALASDLRRTRADLRAQVDEDDVEFARGIVEPLLRCVGATAGRDPSVVPDGVMAALREVAERLSGVIAAGHHAAGQHGVDLPQAMIVNAQVLADRRDVLPDDAVDLLALQLTAECAHLVSAAPTARAARASLWAQLRAVAPVAGAAPPDLSDSDSDSDDRPADGDADPPAAPPPDFVARLHAVFADGVAGDLWDDGEFDDDEALEGAVSAELALRLLAQTSSLLPAPCEHYLLNAMVRQSMRTDSCPRCAVRPADRKVGAAAHSHSHHNHYTRLAAAHRFVDLGLESAVDISAPKKDDPFRSTLEMLNIAKK